VILQGLVNRLFGQISSAVDFDQQVTDFYMAVLDQVTIKPVIAGSLNISRQKAEDLVNQITEEVMSSILDYRAYCAIEECKIQ
jgi:hypothetical protein